MKIFIVSILILVSYFKKNLIVKDINTIEGRMYDGSKELLNDNNPPVDLLLENLPLEVEVFVYFVLFQLIMVKYLLGI